MPKKNLNRRADGPGCARVDRREALKGLAALPAIATALFMCSGSLTISTFRRPRASASRFAYRMFSYVV
jgi:hypothetical protein